MAGRFIETTLWGKNMEEWKNPVIERQIFWMEHAWNETLQNSSNGKYKIFFLLSGLSADDNKSVPKEVWFDFVDGIFYLILLKESKGYNFSLSKIEALTKKGFEEIISYLRRPEFQRAIIERHHQGSGTKDLGEGFQTTLDNESLLKFNQLAKMTLIGEESVVELIGKFIQKKRKVYGLEKLQESNGNPKSEASKKKKYKDGASIEKLALLLIFTDDKIYNHDFEKISKEYEFENGEKLKKTFSLFRNNNRRIGPCKEVSSQTQMINRIADYDWAIQKLPIEKKQKAINERNTLNARLFIEE